MPHAKSCWLRQFLLFILLFLCVYPNIGYSASLNFTVSQTPPSLRLVLKADKIEKLAGLKISATYPDSVLKYKAAAKTKATTSFMHVVNDKIPGKLIIVMASAQGISGSDVALLDLDFMVLPGKNVSSSSIIITECQLMTEDLKEIACNTYAGKDLITVPIANISY